jgi:Spy/CpxP family protein refolding chaperone
MVNKIIAGVFVAVVAISSASAQDEQPRKEGFHNRSHSYGMMKQLNLTDQQKTEMKSINENFRTQLTDLKKNEDITVREWKSRMKNIQTEHKEKIQSLLTDEQKASIKKMGQERKFKHFHHKGRKGGQQRFEKMKTELGLSAAQVDALKKSRTEGHEKMKALRDNKSLSNEQKKVEMKKFRDQQRESFKSVLTEDQLKKLEQMKSHRQKPVQQ